MTWTEALAYQGGGTDPLTPGPSVQIGGLAYDPANLDTVYVGLLDAGTCPPRRDSLGAHVSRDAGITWADVGPMDVGAANDLALSGDGTYLYAATDQGVFQTRLNP